MHLRNSSQTFIVIVLILFSAFGGYFAGKNEVKISWEKTRPNITVKNLEAPNRGDTTIDFRLFWDVFDRLEQQYIEKSALDIKKMYYGAIGGMVAALGDPYTVFLPPTQNKETKEELAGHFDGIGAELGVKDKKIVVIAPLKDSPAEKAGIKPGDWIIKVDGKEIYNSTLPEVVTKIRGQKGTKVSLNVAHENQTKPIDIDVVRDTIVVKSVKWEQKEDTTAATLSAVQKDQSKPLDKQSLIEPQQKDGKKVAVIHLIRFGEGTNDEWEKIVGEIITFKNENRDTYKGIVLDLRNNPGGFLTGAVYIASEFLPDGPVVLQENAKGQQQTYSVNRVGRLTTDPLVVLINKGSASASEIVSGALQDRKRAKLIGEKSFGKGTIQEAQDLSEGAGLHITTAKWLTPNGNWVNKTDGLAPTIEVKAAEASAGATPKDNQLEAAVEELVQ